MKTAKILSFTTLVAMAMGACSVSLAEEVKGSSTSTEIVSVEGSDLRNEEALRVAVGDFDDVEFLLSAEEVEAIADNVYISLNGVSAKGDEGSGSSMFFSGEASGQVEATQSASTTFNGALILASKTTTSDAVTTGVGAVAMSMSSDKSTEQYATDAGKSYYEQVSISNSGSAVTTYSATSFLGNSNSVGDGNGGYGTSAIDSGIVPYPSTPIPMVTTRTWVGGTALAGSTSYNWSNGSNWSSTGWNDGDSATFDATGSAYSTVTVDTDITVTDLKVSGDYTFEYSTDASLTVTGTVTIGSTSLLTITGGTTAFSGQYTYVGYEDTGSLTITGGETTFNGDYTYIGGIGGTGTITILGSDTVVTFETELILGSGFAVDHYGEGEIIIGSLEDTGDGPNVTFKTGNSIYSVLYLGDFSGNTGKITINSGTTIFDTAVYLAYSYGSTGTIEINGGTTTFDDVVYLGYGDGYSSEGDESTGTLSINGGKNTFNGEVDVGYWGTGEMTITDGTNTFKSTVDVGFYEGSTGTITISGGKNTFNGEVDVGYSGGTGTIEIKNGTNTFSGHLYIGGSGTGEMTITGGSTTLKGASTIADNSSLSVSGGTLTIEKKIGTSQTGSVTFSDTGKLIVTQTLLATAGELEEGETAAVAVITANTITFGSTTLDYLDSSDSGDVTELVSGYINVQSGKYRVIEWYYYADTGTLYAIVILPEPSMFGVFAGFGALGLIATRRRRRKAAQPNTSRAPLGLRNRPRPASGR